MIRSVSRLLAAALSLCFVVPALAQVQPGQSPLTISKGGTGAATASGARTNLGLAIGTNVQAWDADLDALAALSGTSTIYYRSAANTWTGVTIGALLQFSGGTLNVGDAELVALAGLTSANNKCFYWTGSGTAATYDCSSYGRGLINAADASAARSTLALVIGTDVQAWDAELAAIAGLATAANKCTYWSGTATAALYDCSSYGRSLANAADASALRTLGGLVIGTDVQAFDSDLSALSANSSNGIWARTGSGTGAARTITAPAAGITISNGDGVSGNPTLALANDLAALEGLSSTGIARRTGTDAWSVGTAVANSELATMATGTFKGNVAGSTASPSDLTATQVTAALNGCVGDSGSGGTKGLVPAPGAGDAAGGKFLAADCTFKVPAGGGGGGMTDTERQNAALGLIYGSKFYGGYRRVINQFADGFKATDGISSISGGNCSGSSSNCTIDTTNGRVYPTSTGLTRITGGTPAVQGGGTAANINDNNPATTVSWTPGDLSAAGINSRFLAKIDYGSNKLITKIEAKSWSQTSGSGAARGFYYSTDGTTWTQLGSAPTVTSTPADYSVTGSVTARYVAIILDALDWTGFVQTLGDLNAYIATPDNMTVTTTAQTAGATVSNGRVVIEYDDACVGCTSVALNTDVSVEVTLNGGTNWASATLSSAGTGQSGRKVAETADTASTSGTTFAARFKTSNNKFIYLHGISLTVH